jgi:Putative porin
MKRQILSGAITAGIFIACAATASAQDSDNSARLQKLEQAVTQLQAENQQLKNQIQGELSTAVETQAQPNGKFDIASSVTSIQIFGDLMMCYRVNEGMAAGRDAGDTGQQDRMRYRLHLGTNVNVADGWTMGVVLETASIGRGSLVTLGAGGINDGAFAKGNVGNGVTSGVSTSVLTGVGTPTTVTAVEVAKVTTAKVAGSTVVTSVTTTSGKVVTGYAAPKTTSLTNGKTNFQDALFVGQVFLKYHPVDWMTLEAGKFRPNLVSTRMIWDADICPEGLGENFLWHFGGDTAAHGPAGPAGPTGYDKDGKESKMVAPPQGMSFDLFANFAQYVYDDAGFENAFNSGSGTTASPLTQNADNTSNWLLGFQLGGKVNFTPTTYFQVAPTYYTYTEGGSWSNSGFFNGDNALVIVNKNAATVLNFNQTSTNNLGIFDVPVEFGSRIGNIPFTVFGDFADNLYSQERAANAGHPDKGNEGIAWQAGLSIGQIKHKGDWEIRGWYQRSEQFALDPNLVDDDIFDGRLNMQGIYLKATYAIADAVAFSLEYSNGHRIDSSLGTAGVGQLGTAPGFPLQSVNFVYASFVLKF